MEPIAVAVAEGAASRDPSTYFVPSNSLCRENLHAEQEAHKATLQKMTDVRNKLTACRVKLRKAKGVVKRLTDAKKKAKNKSDACKTPMKDLRTSASKKKPELLLASPTVRKLEAARTIREQTVEQSKLANSLVRLRAENRNHQLRLAELERQVEVDNFMTCLRTAMGVTDTCLRCRRDTPPAELINCPYCVAAKYCSFACQDRDYDAHRLTCAKFCRAMRGLVTKKSYGNSRYKAEVLGILAKTGEERSNEEAFRRMAMIAFDTSYPRHLSVDVALFLITRNTQLAFNLAFNIVTWIGHGRSNMPAVGRHDTVAELKNAVDMWADDSFSEGYDKMALVFAFLVCFEIVEIERRWKAFDVQFGSRLPWVVRKQIKAKLLEAEELEERERLLAEFMQANEHCFKNVESKLSDIAYYLEYIGHYFDVCYVMYTLMKKNKADEVNTEEEVLVEAI
jgi:hypothetical protein